MFILITSTKYIEVHFFTQIVNLYEIDENYSKH